MPLGDRTTVSLASKAATALPTTYGSGWRLDFQARSFTRFALLLSYVYGSASDFRILLSYSHDGVTYFPVQRLNSAALEDDVLTKAPGADDSLAVEFTARARYVRVEAIRTGGSASDTLAAEVVGQVGA